MARKVKKEEGNPQGSNVPDGEKVMGFIERIENVDTAIASEKGEFMRACKALQDDKKEIYKEAKGAGFNKKALKSIVKRRYLENSIQEVRDDLEGDDQDSYDALLLALEKIAA